MNNLAAADINRHMVDRLSFAIEYQIARLCFRQRNPRSTVRLRSGRMRMADAVFILNAQNKTGTMGAFGQAGSPPYIRIPEKLLSILTQIDSHIRHALSI